MDLSDDGRAILLYILDVRKKFYLTGFETGLVIEHRKLMILDAATGKASARSTDFWPDQWTAPLRFRLSPKGDFALAYGNFNPGQSQYLSELP